MIGKNQGKSYSVLKEKIHTETKVEKEEKKAEKKLALFPLTQELKLVEIVEVRSLKNKNKKEAKRSESCSSAEEMPEIELQEFNEEAEKEFYVHFLGENKRHDRWLSASQLFSDELEIQK